MMTTAEGRACPICGEPMKRNGKTKSGTQRWRCKSCGASSAGPSLAVYTQEGKAREPRSRKPCGPKKKTWTENDVRMFKELCAIFCTRKEVAAVMGVGVKTLDRLIAESLPDTPTFAEAYDLYSSAGKESLRRKLYEKAMSGDRAVLIFMAKNHLGMSDDGKRAQGEDSSTGMRANGLLGGSRWASGRAANG